GLGHVEAADEIDHHRGLELRERHRRFAPEHASGAEDAGAVDRDVEAIEERTGRGDAGDDAVLAAYVGAEIARVRIAELRYRRGALFVVHVEKRDLAAVADDALRDGEAEAGDAAGDDGLDRIGFHGRSRLRMAKDAHSI